MTKKNPPKSFKTNIHTIFKTDERQEEEGAWVTVNEYTGLAIKIRRIKSDYASKAYEKRVREQMGEGTLRKPKDDDGSEMSAIFHAHIAEVILCDWKNMRDEDTNELIPYSTDVAFELVSEIKDFREYIIQQASDRDTFREKADAEAEGN